MEIIPSTPVRPRRTGRVALAVLAGALVVLGLAGAFPVLMGMERVGMVDDALGPELPRGSYVLVRQVAAQDLRVGDLVGLRDPTGEGSVIRRVGSMDGGWLELTGAVAGVEPRTVRAVRVRAVVSHVPWLGYPLLVLPAWPAPYLLLGLAGAVLLAGLRLTDDRRRGLPPVLASVVIPRQAPPPGAVPRSVPDASPAAAPAVPTPPVPRAPAPAS